MKKNGVFLMSWDEYQSIKRKLVLDPDVFVGEADGTLIHDKMSFCRTILFAMGGSETDMARVGGFESFSDVMSDMEWFKADEWNMTGKPGQYCLAILNQEMIEAESQEQYNIYSDVLCGLVYDWTQGREHYGNIGACRDFTVFLVDSRDNPPDPSAVLYSWLPPEYGTADFPWQDEVGSRYNESDPQSVGEG